MTILSDLPIPRTSDILDRACELLSMAYRQHDGQAAGQLGRLIKNLPSARLCWELGTLHIVSPSGGRYQVTRAGCSCPNGTKSHARACWHVALYELLLDMFETEADSADDDDCLDHGPYADDDCPKCATPWYTRAPAARARCVAL